MNTPKKGHDMDPTRPGEDIEGEDRKDAGRSDRGDAHTQKPMEREMPRADDDRRQDDEDIE
jgi:hypothetical protein